jgi:hypothetical protein
MEKFGDDADLQERETRRHSAMEPKRSAVFAVVNVGDTVAHVGSDPDHGCQIAFMLCPIEPTGDLLGDPSHSEILGLPHPDDEPEAEAVGDLISQKVLRTFPTMSDGDDLAQP